MSTRHILYRTTSIGVSGTLNAKIRIINLTDDITQEYKRQGERISTHLQETHLRVVVLAAQVPPESIELIASDNNGHYYLVTREDES